MRIADFSGVLLTPADAAYEQARSVFNAGIDRRPRFIAQCRNERDVVSALRHALHLGLPVSVRCGGHGVHGGALVEDGLTLDLRLMRTLNVDAEQRTLWADAGLTWGDVYRGVVPLGLATTGGAVASVGIGGYSQGSGNGWLMRQYGFTIDNILAMRVVTADGQLRTVTATQHADLFWALRGGVGNFGVVTAFKYQLHAIAPTVLAGSVVYPADRAEEYLVHFASVFEDAAEATNAVATLATMNPNAQEPSLVVSMAHFGPIDEGEDALRPLRSFPAKAIDDVRVTPMLEFLTSMDDTALRGMHNYWQGRYLHTFDATTARTFVEQARQSRHTVAQIQRIGGAVDRIADESAAFNRRSIRYLCGLPTLWRDPRDSTEHVGRTRAFARAMQPFTARVCLNHVSEVSEQQLIDAFGPVKYRRLREIKTEHDPHNVFRSNLNIAPLL